MTSPCDITKNPMFQANQGGTGLKPYNLHALFTDGILADNPMVEAKQDGPGMKPLISVVRPNGPRSLFSNYIYTINPLISIYKYISSIQ